MEVFEILIHTKHERPRELNVSQCDLSFLHTMVSKKNCLILFDVSSAGQ